MYGTTMGFGLFVFKIHLKSNLEESRQLLCLVVLRGRGGESRVGFLVTKTLQRPQTSRRDRSFQNS